MPSPLDNADLAARFAEGPARLDDDAAYRFSKTDKADPFPLIPAALLNSSDFYNYVAATGMVWPYENRQLKSASYSIRIGDQVIFWSLKDKEFK